jgi:hypothetical protein
MNEKVHSLRPWPLQQRGRRHWQSAAIAVVRCLSVPDVVHKRHCPPRDIRALHTGITDNAVSYHKHRRIENPFAWIDTAGGSIEPPPRISAVPTI